MLYWEFPVEHLALPERQAPREPRLRSRFRADCCSMRWGITGGVPGPGGVYTLARDRRLITLHQIVTPFDRTEIALTCPVGEDWCGSGPQCPLHLELEKLRQRIADFLHHSSLARFQKLESTGNNPVQSPILPLQSGKAT